MYKVYTLRTRKGFSILYSTCLRGRPEQNEACSWRWFPQGSARGRLGYASHSG